MDTIDEKGDPWRPGFFRCAPWLGLGAMLGALFGILAAILVLFLSNDKPVEDWNVQPTVSLAIASTATNILLHFALTQAVSVAWWRRAVKKDTTIADLHHNWDSGRSLWAALTSGRHFNSISLASIFVALVPINGPLLQRASHVRQKTFSEEKTVFINISQEIPKGYTWSSFHSMAELNSVLACKPNYYLLTSV